MPDYETADAEAFFNEAEEHLALELKANPLMSHAQKYAYLYGFLKGTIRGFVDSRDRRKK